MTTYFDHAYSQGLDPFLKRTSISSVDELALNVLLLPLATPFIAEPIESCALGHRLELLPIKFVHFL